MKDSAFSLVEMNLAILLVGVGLLALFTLFPMGLQQSDLAVQDSQEAMFGEYVLSTIEGNAFAITDWNDWRNTNYLDDELVRGITNVPRLTVQNGSLVASNSSLNFPTGSDRYLTYKLRITDKGLPIGKLKAATLKVASGRNRNLGFARDYYTEIMFMGE